MKVDAPHRGCTYGPEAYADGHGDCRNTGLNIQRGLRKVNMSAMPPRDPSSGNNVLLHLNFQPALSKSIISITLSSQTKFLNFFAYLYLR